MNSAVHRRGDSELSRDPIDAMAAYDLAREIAQKAGFTIANVSRVSETCYKGKRGTWETNEGSTP